MDDIKNWTKVNKGLYRYVIAPGCCYEIHIWEWDRNDKIEDAAASLYVIGD